MVYLTRSEHFNAAHKLYNPAWSYEKNEEVFGKCANENWHGHNYELLITVKAHGIAIVTARGAGRNPTNGANVSAVAKPYSANAMK